MCEQAYGLLAQGDTWQCMDEKEALPPKGHSCKGWLRRTLMQILAMLTSTCAMLTLAMSTATTCTTRTATSIRLRRGCAPTASKICGYITNGYM